MPKMKITLRPEVQWFAERMELALRRNRHKGGWKKEYYTYLFDRLGEEAKELSASLCEPFPEKTIYEAVDVANFAMMIADLKKIDMGRIKRRAKGKA